MPTTKTYQAEHETNGNITSIFVTTSSVGTQVTLTPDRGNSVSQFDLPSQLQDDFELAGEEQVNRIIELQRQHRLDMSRKGTLVKI
jgi:hypothetical protein